MDLKSINKTVAKGVSAVVVNLAVAASLFSVGNAANAYYTNRRGAYARGTYMADKSLTNLSKNSWSKGISTPKIDNKTEAVALTKKDLLLLKNNPVKDLVLVDANVKNYDSFTKLARPGIDVVTIPRESTGIETVLNKLKEYENIHRVHIFASADENQMMYLGGNPINRNKLSINLQLFNQERGTVREGGEYLVYSSERKDSETENILELTSGNAEYISNATSELNSMEASVLSLEKGDINSSPKEGSIARNSLGLNFFALTTFSGLGADNSGGTGFKTVTNIPELVVSNNLNLFGTELYGSGGAGTEELVLKADGVDAAYFDLNDLYVSNYSGTSNFSGTTLTLKDKDGSTIKTMTGTNSLTATPVSIGSFFTTNNALPVTGVAEIIFSVQSSSATSNFTLESIDIQNPVAPADTPVLSTTTFSGVNATSATLGGNMTDVGGSSVTDRGIVWNTTGSPDTGDNQVPIGTGPFSTGSFSQSVDLLPFGTTIYVRAYATNSDGTAYGPGESFTTSNTVTRNLTTGEGWRMLAPPASVSLETFLGPIWTQGASGGDISTAIPNVYTWSTSIDGNNQADWQAVTDLTNTTLDGGQGFLVQVYADPDFDGPTSPGFPQILSVTGSEFASGVTPTMNSNATGWTLLGNPFASAITFSDLSPTNLSSTVYAWDPNDDTGDGGQAGQPSGSWKTWNGSTGDLTGGRIAPFQGFLVQNTSTGSSVTFSQSSKTSTATTFLGKENSTLFVRLELQGNGMHNSAWLEFTADGSTEKTGGDAWELQPLSEHYALLATQKEDGSLVDIGRYPQAAELEIPLITEATQAGSYTITVTDFEASGQTLYLNDLQRGISIRLKSGMQYSFEIDQAAKAPADPFAILQDGLRKQVGDNHRFVISSSALENTAGETPQQFNLEQNYPNPFNPVTVIRYQLPVNSDVRLEVFDMAGRQIATLVNTQQEAGTHSVNFDGSNLSSGVYIYRMQADGITFTKKLTLIK